MQGFHARATDRIAEISGSGTETKLREWRADLDRANDVKSLASRLKDARTDLERSEAAKNRRGRSIMQNRTLRMRSPAGMKQVKTTTTIPTIYPRHCPRLRWTEAGSDRSPTAVNNVSSADVTPGVLNNRMKKAKEQE